MPKKLWCIVRSYPDHSGVVDVHGIWSTEETANSALPELEEWAQSAHLFEVKPLWDMN